MWLIKRVLVDGWDVDRAVDEATQLGLTSAALRQFALDEISKRKKIDNR
jgi:hypothetical protein